MLLAVDDSTDLLKMYRTLFTRANVEHVCVSSLTDVQALGEALWNLDTALLDIHLGVGQPNGLDVARWLREHGFTPRIVFITGHANEHALVQQAGSLGRVLEKPVGPRDLLAAVRGPRAPAALERSLQG